MKMRRFVYYILVLCTLCLSSGCGLEGLASVLGTPSYDEVVVPAEFDLTKHKDKTVLVLVDQPPYITAKVNMRFYLTEAIDSILFKHVGIPDANLVGYDQVTEFRAANAGWSMLSAVEIGSRMGADLVVHIQVEELELEETGEADYLRGKLNTRASLLDVKTGERLWPDSEASRPVKVGFEVETKGWDFAVARLASASAHCTTRYLYNCKKKSFNTFDDRSTVGWENWEQ